MDNAIGASTAYRYLHEGIDALASATSDIHQAITTAKDAGHEHLNLDGAVVHTDRPPGPTARTCGGPGSTNTTAGTSSEDMVTLTDLGYEGLAGPALRMPRRGRRASALVRLMASAWPGVKPG